MKRTIESTRAPAAIGPYSQGVVHEGKIIFLAGQIGIDPATSELVPGGIEAQTVRTMENIKAVLEDGLSNMDRVLKTTIFLKDIADFATVNAIYARYFTDKPPARSTIQVAALPKGALLEIECIASAV
ncbi:MAG: RidA family protein [Calditrichaeota bacterium]|nr:RidA family protein [Calditrichota bacterium]